MKMSSMLPCLRGVIVLGLLVNGIAAALSESDRQQGQLLLGRGEYQAAEAIYRAATERDEADVVARSSLAIALIHQEEYDEAESHLEIVFDRDPIYLADDIAMQYARINPRRAAQWAVELGQVPDRPLILSTMVIGWTRQDPEAAREWVTALPKGEVQDAGLGGLIRAIADVSLPDSELLAAFSSDWNRQWWLRSSIVPLTRRDPEAARRVIDSTISDPVLRQEAERFYEIGLRLRARAP